ncbi:MAG: DUF4982 domain-containing protein [Spirochaetaceae bacterium]|jgi:beta-galactosidase|nr:DUF4982 domain-containing protein [Spirochaetaceae bacterium]
MNETVRTCVSFNEAWRFCLGDDGAYAQADFDDEAWKTVTLPHDWGMDYPLNKEAPCGGGGGYAVTGVGWYRKTFDAPLLPKHRNSMIQFDGVYMNSTVFLNGVAIGGRHYGYSEFTVDLKQQLLEGKNTIALRVDNSMQPNSRWYTGSGIYRNVWLLGFNTVHIDNHGVFVITNGLYEHKKKARLQIQCWIRNESTENVDVGVEQHIFDAQGKTVLKDASALHVKAGTAALTMVMPTVEEPILWTDKNPYLYTVETVLVQKGAVVDQCSTRIGIRTAAFDCDKGFLLNGEQVKIKGMCVHHDGGLTGAAAYPDTWKRRLTLLKDMGCNGIRCAHNPPAPELLDICDELGFLVMDEAFDEWLLSKFKSADYGYSRTFTYGGSQFFANDGEADLITMLRRDRNHPSVILWSIGNEILEQSALEGLKVLRRLQHICHQEDPSRLVCSACDNIAAPQAYRTQEDFENSLDLVGYNYTGRWGIRAETLYDEDRKKYPSRRMIGSENPSAGGLRGNYEPVLGSEFLQSGYDTITLAHEFLWRYTASRDFVAGDYLWTGIDYLGESCWPLKGAPSGPLDTAGFPKDTFYYFRSIWNDEAFTLHILPHWNWVGKEGKFITVIGYTNCEEVSLYLNGRLVGTKGYDFPNVGATKAWNIKTKITKPTTHDLHLCWDLPFEAGELRAVGRANGKVVKEVVVKTTGAPFRLNAAADKEAINLHAIAHIEISTTDEEGLWVPDAQLPISVSLEGGIALLGLDNGDLQDMSPFYGPRRRLYAGRLLCVIRGMSQGAARATIHAEGMNDIALPFTVQV